MNIKDLLEKGAAGKTLTQEEWQYLRRFVDVDDGFTVSDAGTQFSFGASGSAAARQELHHHQEEAISENVPLADPVDPAAPSNPSKRRRPDPRKSTIPVKSGKVSTHTELEAELFALLAVPGETQQEAALADQAAMATRERKYSLDDLLFDVLDEARMALQDREDFDREEDFDPDFDPANPQCNDDSWALQKESEHTGDTSNDTSGDDTSGDDTSGDDTSGDDTSGDDTSDTSNNTSGDDIGDGSPELFSGNMKPEWKVIDRIEEALAKRSGACDAAGRLRRGLCQEIWQEIRADIEKEFGVRVDVDDAKGRQIIASTRYRKKKQS